VRAADTVGRVGGDEFVVLLQNVDSAEAAWGVAEKIRLALNEPFVLDGQSVSIAATIGLVVYPLHGSSAEELTRHADLAMYQAKENGRNQVMLFQCDLAAAQGMAT
jgi:diguanylate cyclase (GGDEF)-like protein